MQSQHQDSDCQVCFVHQLKLHPYSQIITCKGCHAKCHKSCYNPSLQKTSFRCDQCSQSIKDKQLCIICGNGGLLKKIDNCFGHPICLLYSQSVIVIQYQTLQFAFIKEESNKKKDTKTKCKICGKAGFLQKCFANCHNYAHMYCAWKSYQGPTQQAWNHNTIVQNYSYRSFFDNKICTYIECFGPAVQKLYNAKKINEKIKFRQFELACPQHIDSVFQCCTNQKYFHEKNIQYIQCDQCLRWYHQKCLDKRVLPKSQKQKFVCPCCEKFEVIIKSPLKTQFYLSKFPRLNVCEMIFLQYRLQVKNYRLSKNEKNIIFSVPFEPSVVYVENVLTENIDQNIQSFQFKDLCQMNISTKAQKKNFKNIFKQRFEILFFLYTKTKSLNQVKEESYDELVVKKSQIGQRDCEGMQNVQLSKWIQVLRLFNEKNSKFVRQISRLIKKVQRLKNEIKIQNFKKEQESAEDEYNHSESIYNQSSLDLKIKKQQQKQVKIQSSENLTPKNQSQDDNNNSQSRQQTTKKQQKTKKQHQIPINVRYSKAKDELQMKKEKTKKQTSIRRQNQAPHKGQLKRRKSLKIVEEKDEPRPEDRFLKQVIDNQKEQNLLKQITNIQNRLKSYKGNKQILERQLSQKSNSKAFSIYFYLGKNLSPADSTQCIKLQALMTHVQSLIDKFKQQLSNRKMEKSENLSETPFKQSRAQRNQQYEKKLTSFMSFLQNYVLIVIRIYGKNSHSVKRNIKPKIQFFLKSANQMKDLFHDFKFQAANYKKVYQTISSQQKSQEVYPKIMKDLDRIRNQQDLIRLRIQIQKKKNLQILKKIPFTSLNASKMQKQYEKFCQSSTDMNSSLAKTNLRRQCIQFQKKTIQYWLQMYGFFFNFASSLKRLPLSQNSQEQQSSIQSKSLYNNESFGQNKEPCDIITEALQHETIFKDSLKFFSQIKSSGIKFRIFNSSFIQTLNKLAFKCIQCSSEQFHVWTESQSQFSALKYIFQHFGTQYTDHKKTILTNKQFDSRKKQFQKIQSIFVKDQLFSQEIQHLQNHLFSNSQVMALAQNQKIPQQLKFYEDNGVLTRIQTLKLLKKWIDLYFICIKDISFQRLVNKQLHTEQQKLKYPNKRKRTFTQLTKIIGRMSQLKFPSCHFRNKLMQLYKEAGQVQAQIQKYFDKQNKSFNRAIACRNQQFMIKDIEIDPFNFNGLFQSPEQTFSNEEFQKLIQKISQSSIVQIVTFEVERKQILSHRVQYLKIRQQIQTIIQNDDLTVSIKDLNGLFIKIVSYPFYYKNLKVFHSFLEKRAQKYILMRTQRDKQQKRRNQIIQKVKKQYSQIFERMQKTGFLKQIISRQQIRQKLEMIETIQGFEQIENQPEILELAQKIQETVYNFDKIYDSLVYSVRKVNQNKPLEHQEVLKLEQKLQNYRTQKIYSFEFQCLSNDLNLYKTAFGIIPQNSSQICMVLEQLKNLRPAFHTKQFETRRYDIQQMKKKLQSMPR